MRSLAVVMALCLALAFPGASGAATTHVKTAPDFTLLDDTGHPFTLSHYRGQPVVLFFGYAHCPDVCPTILANLKHARELVGGSAKDLRVALITVDPQRDTQASLRQFVSVFDPSFLGLTGTSAQLAPVYRAYHVRIAKQEANSNGYLVSHTAFVYYIGRDGRLLGYGTWSDPTDTLEEDLRTIVAAHS